MKQMYSTAVILGLCFYNFALSNQAFGQTLISDDFNGTAINTNVWTVIIPFCDSEMYETNGVAVFKNCGTLLSKLTLPSRIQVNGRFLLTNSDFGKFEIYTRTSGATATDGQITNGVQVQFLYQTDNGTPGLDTVTIGNSTTNVSANYPIALNTFYNFQITDDGTNVSVYLQNSSNPILSMPATNHDGALLGMQCREGACAGSTISAGNTTELTDLTVIDTTFATGIITLPTVTISGSTNQSYTIQYVTNLLSTNWTTLVSNIVLQGSSPYYYPDTNAVGQQQRFYRVVEQ
jgi:hypothetical protein